VGGRGGASYLSHISSIVNSRISSCFVLTPFSSSWYPVRASKDANCAARATCGIGGGMVGVEDGREPGRGSPGAGGGAVFQVHGLEDGVFAHLLLDGADCLLLSAFALEGVYTPPYP
jgi:hypothetical protein